MLNYTMIKAVEEMLLALSKRNETGSEHFIQLAEENLRLTLKKFESNCIPKPEWIGIDLEQFNDLSYEYFESLINEPFFVSLLLIYTKNIQDLLKEQNWD